MPIVNLHGLDTVNRVPSSDKELECLFQRLFDTLGGGENSEIVNVELLNYPEMVYMGAKIHGKPLGEVEEDVIAQSAEFSYKDAFYVLKGRFESGEQAISRDAKIAYAYALNVLHDRFEMAEQTIAQDSFFSYAYATWVLHGRFKAGEFIISIDPKISYMYARDVIHGRFPLGERAISRTIWIACKYAWFLHRNKRTDNCLESKEKQNVVR